MRRSASLVLVPTLLLLGGGLAAAQTGVIDQANTANDNVGWNMGYFQDMQQVVPVTTTGQLEGIKIRMASNSLTNGLPMALFAGQGPFLPTDVPLWSGTAYVPYPGGYKDVFVDLSLASLYFNAGDFVTIRIGDGVAPTPGVSLVGNEGFPTAYYNFGFYEEGVGQNLSRLWFETWFFGCAGSTVSYGLGCAGTGAVFPKLSLFGCPVEGNQVLVEVSKGLGGSTALLLFGLSEGNTPIGGVCPLLVTPLVGPTIPLPLSGLGAGKGAISLPGVLPLGSQGATFTLQAWVLDPAAIPGAAASNGLKVTVG